MSLVGAVLDNCNVSDVSKYYADVRLIHPTLVQMCMWRLSIMMSQKFCSDVTLIHSWCCCNWRQSLTSRKYEADVRLKHNPLLHLKMSMMSQKYCSDVTFIYNWCCCTWRLFMTSRKCDAGVRLIHHPLLLLLLLLFLKADDEITRHLVNWFNLGLVYMMVFATEK